MNINIIKQLINEYKSIADIANELNTTKSKVRTYLKNNNLKTKGKAGMKNGIYTHCICCNKETINGKMYCSTTCKANQHIKNNPTKYKNKKDNSKLLRETFKLLAIKYKGNKCSCCGYNKNYSALSFHHLDPNEKDFSFSSIRSITLKENHIKELNKCILLCENCHQEEHHRINQLIENPSKQTVKGRKIRDQLIQLKDGKCEICNYDKCNSSLTFHHINDFNKLFEIDNRVCNGYKYERLLEEVNKCQLLCHNCHMELHHPNNLL